ncbi:hypothetical protein EG328_001105 [Venturia inaequalis]|uniref:Uncharacterized protein n=1 Tax=Venturia inaequalis TaxID=5025 RepID=A0A8H3Z0U6_VENIN|nr:hypothetical protein EG328_001105 [Venturia inaequalis]
MLFFLLAIITISLLFTQSSAENVTSVNQMIFALSGSRVSHAYENVFGSVIAADKNAITVHLDCKPSPAPSLCSDQDATITAGPSTLVYTSSSGTFFAYHACSKTVTGGEFVCTYHNNIVPQAGIGGYAPMQITAGIDKLISAPVPTITDSGAASCWGGNGRSSWTMLWSGLGITFLIIAVFG